MSPLRNLISNSTGVELTLVFVTATWLVLGILALLAGLFRHSPVWPYLAVFTVMALAMVLLVLRTTRTRPTGLDGLVAQGQFSSDAGISYQKRATKALIIVIALLLVGIGMLVIVSHCITIAS